MKKSLCTLACKFSAVSPQRMNALFDKCQSIISQEIDGSFVECGVWKGGCIGLMARLAQEENKDRKVYAFDSWEGLPDPSKYDIDYKSRSAIEYRKNDPNKLKLGWSRGTIFKCDINIFYETLRKMEVDKVEVKKGWFNETLPNTEIEKIAILRLDGDWYESTKICLELLYDKVIKGGYVIIDDYGHWKGCKKAVDEFLENRNLKIELKRTDYTEHYFIKP